MKLFKNRKLMEKLIEQNEKILNEQSEFIEQIEKMNGTVKFFSGIAELFAHYMVYDMETSMAHNPKKHEIYRIALKYLEKREIFWTGYR